MKRYFFLGVGVGFIIAGITATIYIDTSIKPKTNKVQSEKIVPENSLLYSDNQEIKTPSENNNVEIVTESVPEQAEERKAEAEADTFKVKEPEVKKEIPVENKQKDKPVKKENTEKVNAKKEEPPKEAVKTAEKKEGMKPEKQDSKQKEERTAPLSPTGEKIAVESEKESVKNIKQGIEKNGDYYIQLITTSSYEECERLIKKIKEVEFTAVKKGSKYAVVSRENYEKDEGQKVLKKLEKYKVKGLLLKKSR